MSDEIFFDGKRYISANEAGASSGLTRDYIARLCRDGKISGRRIGKHWYVAQASFRDFLITQEYAKSRRSESLTSERTREYHGVAQAAGTTKSIPARAPSNSVKSQEFFASGVSRSPRRSSVKDGGIGMEIAPSASTVSHVSRVISSRADEIKNKMALAVAAQTGDGVVRAKDFLNTPGGFAHAALSATHVPVYALSPLTEFFHKVVALTLTLMLTLGTYAAVDPSYARFASESVRENVNAALDSYHAATGGGLSELANRTQTQVAAAAENPEVILASVQAALTESVPDLAERFARALNSRVNDFVYSIAFPFDLVSSRGIAARNEKGSVSVSVVPVTNTGGAIVTTQGPSGPATIINNPVVERIVETTRLVSAGGISEELLDKKLAELDNKLSSQMLVSSAANTTNITNIYAAAASVGRIEHLDGLDLTNPTITGGSISGVSLSAGDISGIVGVANGGTGNSTAPSYGQLLLGDGAGGYSLVATSTLGIAGALLSNANTWTALQLFSAGASTTQLSVFQNAYFGGTATSTFDSTGALTLGGIGTNMILSTNGSGVVVASSTPTAAAYLATSTSATSTFAGGLSVGTTYFNVLQNGRIGIGTAAPTVGFDVGVATKISGDLTLSGGGSLTISASGPVNQSGTGQVTFAGNVDATNGLDVTNANFTVGTNKFTVAQSTGNTVIAGTLGLTGAFNASSTLQATGAARFYSTLQSDDTLTAAGAGTGLSVTNNASIGGTLALTGAGTFGSTLSISGLLTAATTTFLGDVALSGKKITGVATPSSDQDAANKTYVDSVAQGLSLKDSVAAGTTANITLSGEQTIDGVSLVAGDRVLVKDQTDQTKNGIYVVSSGVWSRSADADANSEVTSGMFTFIADGTLNASSGWVLTTTGAITLGTSLLTFTQFSGAGQITAGTGITKSANTLNVIGTTDRITANADSIDIASTYVGQTSITTVGTLTSGSLGSGFGNINIGASSITGGVATFSSIVGSAINGTGDLSVSGSGTFSSGLTVVGTLTAATSTFSGDVALGGKKITGLANPTSAQEAATKAYVDAIAQGLTVKASVRAGTTANITLSGAQTIDGVSVVAGDRVLVKNQTTGSENGIYTAAAGAWSRSTDANENSEVISGIYTFITEGTTLANTGWSLITPNTITLDTTSLTFTQFSGSAETTAGDGLTKSGNTVNAVGTSNRISVTADAIDISSSYVGQSSLTTVGALTSGSIGSGFGSINIGSSALTAGTSIFSTATSYGTLSVGGTATTSIVGNSATSTFSGGLTLAAGNVNLATAGNFLINNALVLNATGLGSGVLSSSLAAVGALDSGSITTGFGDINIGANTLDAGATTLSSLTVSGGATTTSFFATTASSTNLFSSVATIGSNALLVNSAGNVGLGTSTPWAKLSVAGVAGATTPLFSISSSSAAFATSTIFHIDSNGNVGIGTTTPAGKFSVTGSGTGTGILAKFFNSAFTAVMSILDNGTAYFLGNVGIGTTTPARKLSVTDTVASAQVAFAYDDTRYAELRVDSTGDFNLAASGGDFYLNNDNFWVCTGGSITTGGCPSGTPTGAGNIIAENKIGIGTTTPAYKLTIETQDTTTNFFQVASSTAQNLFVINANGNVGVGTSTPFARLAVGPGGSIVTTEGSLTDGATITVNWLDGNQQKVTLGGNRTIAFTNYIAGQILRLVVCQDATGSRTLTWPAIVLWNDGTAPTLTTTANKCDLATFIATGATSTLKVFGAAALAF